MPVVSDVSSQVRVISGLPQSALSGPYVGDSLLRRILGLLAGNGFVLDNAGLSFSSPTLTIPAGKIIAPLDSDTAVLVEHPQLTLAVLDTEEVILRVKTESGKAASVVLEARAPATPIGANEILVGARSGSVFNVADDAILSPPRRRKVAFTIGAVAYAAGTDVFVVSPVRGIIKRVTFQTRVQTIGGGPMVVSVNGGTDVVLGTVPSASLVDDLFTIGELSDANGAVNIGDAIAVSSNSNPTAGEVNVVLEIEE